jgi:uncharacterized protein YfaS (alpha-2-macroglobulin family)
MLFLFATTTGCGSREVSKLPATVSAQGTVTLDGKPVENASVVFLATSGSHHATGTTDSAGRFRLKAFPEKDGAVPGSYKVEISKTVITSAGSDGDEALVNVQYGVPVKYSSSTTSELTAEIPKEGTSNLKFELKSM